MAFATTRNVLDGAVTDVNTTKLFNLGERFRDENGSEYIFLTGVASTVAGDWVTYDEVGQTTRLVKAEADKLKPMAIAMGACTASKFGWYQVFGEVAVGNVLQLCIKEVPLYSTATAGSVDDLATAQTKINRAIVRATRGGTDGSTTLYIMYPSAA